MQQLIMKLAPVFAAGFAVQQLLEILTSFLDLDSNPTFQKFKKPILGAVALAAGMVLAIDLNLAVLQPLLTLADEKVTLTGGKLIFEYLVTGLVLSAGTEGINSIVKFMQHAKDQMKPDVDPKKPTG